ncbi:MAG: hypothetical protein EOP07_16805 [Proteobacteria bacterium]|nr:MAG: hypothetical protein EOP07_16805 [Pseudomonadota bacterium]
MTALLTIFAILFALPLQMASFSKAMVHLQEHRIETASSDHEHEHSHTESHSHEHEVANTDSNEPGEHSHGDDQAPHSHAKELSLTFLQSGIARTEIAFEIRPFSTALEPMFQFSTSQSHHSYLSLLRPPIQA